MHARASPRRLAPAERELEQDESERPDVGRVRVGVAREALGRLRAQSKQGGGGDKRQSNGGKGLLRSRHGRKTSYGRREGRRAWQPATPAP
eukprot:409097-Pleurochrysis_carterae.AAC.3